MTPVGTQLFPKFQNEAGRKDQVHFGGRELGTQFPAKTKWI